MTNVWQLAFLFCMTFGDPDGAYSQSCEWETAGLYLSQVKCEATGQKLLPDVAHSFSGPRKRHKYRCTAIPVDGEI